MNEKPDGDQVSKLLGHRATLPCFGLPWSVTDHLLPAMYTTAEAAGVRGGMGVDLEDQEMNMVPNSMLEASLSKLPPHRRANRLWHLCQDVTNRPGLLRHTSDDEGLKRGPVHVGPIYDFPSDGR